MWGAGSAAPMGRSAWCTEEEGRWRWLVEARLAALERKLGELHQVEQIALRPGDGDEQPSKRSAVVGAAQSDSELSEDSDSPSPRLWGACEPATRRRRQLSRGENGSTIVEVIGEHLDEGYNYALCESVWDSSFLAFFDCMGPGCSLVLIFLVGLNALVQGVFCQIVMDNLLTDAYSDEKLSGLLKFRTSTAHSIRQADFTARQSLASQICYQDETVPWAGSQFNHFSHIRDYLGKGGFAGAKLCYLSVFLWLVRMQTELNGIFHCTNSVLQLPRRSRSLLARVGEGEGEGPQLLYVTRMRQLGMLAVLSLRLGIAFSLTYVGVHYLVMTVSLPDLILNSMALVFVIEIDEMLYACFAPTRVKNLLSSLEPLPYYWPQFFQRWPSATSCGKMLNVFLLLVIAGCVLLNPFYDRVAMAGEILCTGNLDFVYTVNPASGIVETTPTHEHNFTDHGLLERSTVVKLAFPDLFPDIKAAQDDNEAVARVLMAKQRPGTVWTMPMPGRSRSAAEPLEGGPHPLRWVRGWLEIAGMDELRDAMVTSKLDAKVRVHTDDFGALAGGPQNFPAAQGKLAALHEMEIGGVKGGVEHEVCYDVLPAQLPATFKSAMHRLFPRSKFETDFSSLRDQLAQAKALLQDCEQFTAFCPLANMTQLRALCPITCGCPLVDFPPAAFYTHQHWGCPLSCRFLRAAGRRFRWANTSARACVDAEPEEFASRDVRHLPGFGWQRIDNYLAAYMDGAWEFLHTRSDFILNAMLVINNPFLWSRSRMNLSKQRRREMALYMTSWSFLRGTQAGRWEFLPGIPHPRGMQGCAFWVSWEVVGVLGINFCETGFFRTLRYSCPQSCHCTGSMEECPDSCGEEPAKAAS